MIRPGSHRFPVAPNGLDSEHPLMAPHQGELQVQAPAGSVLLFDVSDDRRQQPSPTPATHPPLTLSVAARQQGRLWHKTSTNRTADRRIFIGVK